MYETFASPRATKVFSYIAFLKFYLFYLPHSDVWSAWNCFSVCVRCDAGARVPFLPCGAGGPHAVYWKHQPSCKLHSTTLTLNQVSVSGLSSLLCGSVCLSLCQQHLPYLRDFIIKVSVSGEEVLPPCSSRSSRLSLALCVPSAFRR